MSEAVTVPNLMMMTPIVSEESLVRNIHIDTDTVSMSIFSGLTYVNLFKVLRLKTAINDVIKL